VSDIDTVTVDSLKALDSNRPIREADIQPAGFSRSVASGGARNPQIDLAAKHPEIDRLGESVSAPFSKALRLVSVVAIGGDHDDGNIRSKGLGLG
jgi:hypothetical protein